MKKIKFYVEMGLNGCTREETMEFNDDVTEEELEEEFALWLHNIVEGGWYEDEN